MAWVFNADRLKEASVGSQDVVAAQANGSLVAMLPPSRIITVLEALSEVKREIFEAICANEVSHLAVAVGGGVCQVHVEVP